MTNIEQVNTYKYTCNEIYLNLANFNVGIVGYEQGHTYDPPPPRNGKKLKILKIHLAADSLKNVFENIDPSRSFDKIIFLHEYLCLCLNLLSNRPEAALKQKIPCSNQEIHVAFDHNFYLTIRIACRNLFTDVTVLRRCPGQNIYKTFFQRQHHCKFRGMTSVFR